MAQRENWCRVTSTTGGTGVLTLTSVAGYPTFQEAFGSSGTFTVEYAIRASGMRESGVGTFNGSANTLTRTTVARSWVSGVGYGSSAVTLPTSGVVIVCAPTAESVLTVDSEIEIEDITGLQTALDGKSSTGHSHTIAQLTISGDPEVADAVLTPDGWASFPQVGISEISEASDVDTTDRAEGTALFVDADDTTHIYRRPRSGDIEDANFVQGSNDDFFIKKGGLWTNRTPAQARGDIGLSAGGVGFADPAPEARTVELLPKAPRAGTITGLYHKLSSGSLSVAITINGVNVTGLSAVSPGSSGTTTSATAANTFSAGDVVAIVMSSPSTPGVLSTFLDITW